MEYIIEFLHLGKEPPLCSFLKSTGYICVLHIKAHNPAIFAPESTYLHRKVGFVGLYPAEYWFYLSLSAMEHRILNLKYLREVQPTHPDEAHHPAACKRLTNP